MSKSNAILRLPLTGQCGDRRVVRGWARVLDDTFGREELLTKTWRLTSAGYALWSSPRPNRQTVYLHQFVFEHYHGPVPRSREIDHINRDKSNNLPGNLRAVTHSINGANKGRLKRNKTGLTGVHRHKHKWTAYVRVNGKTKYLGTYPTPRAAADAVNEAYRTHFPDVPVPNP